MPAPSEKSEDSGERRRKLYGRRKGPKLSTHQSGLVETLLPGLKVQLRRRTDPRSWFDSPVEEVWLEIGFGAGEHLLWQVEHNTDIGIIGAEPYESGVAKLLSKLYSLSPTGGEGWGEGENVQLQPPLPGPRPPRGRGDLLSRIRIHTGDAREIIEALPDASLARVFLLFPDPWPKKRHHKRRFIQMEILDALARIMKPGAELRFASDDPGYVEWALERVSTHEAFTWLAQRSSDWILRPSDWPTTRYEQKALRGIPAFFRFQMRRRETGTTLANRALGA